MKRHLGIAIMTVCAVFVANRGGAPAFSEEFDASKLLYDSAKLLGDQQEVEAKLAANQARQRDLEIERQNVQRQAAQYNEQRQLNDSTCATTNYYYTHMAECQQTQTDLSTSAAEVPQRQNRVDQELQGVTAETEQLKVRQEQLNRQVEVMALKLKRIEFSGTTQECVARLPKDSLQDLVLAYQQCWDGTSTGKPHLKSEQSESSASGAAKEKKRRKRQE